MRRRTGRDQAAIELTAILDARAEKRKRTGEREKNEALARPIWRPVRSLLNLYLLFPSKNSRYADYWIGIYPLDKVIHSSYNRAGSGLNHYPTNRGPYQVVLHTTLTLTSITNTAPMNFFQFDKYEYICSL